MNRFLVTTVEIAILTCPTFASDPGTARIAKQAIHQRAPSSFSGNLIGLQLPKLRIAPRPLHERLIEFVVCPIKPIVEYFDSPNSRMMRLLTESEDLRQAREEMHRFWMNNQPSVLTYERLNGAIGP
jgi:hypothetical protein